MSRTNQQKSRQWEVLRDKVVGKQDQIKANLAAIQAKESDLEEKRQNIIAIKGQYSSNLLNLEQSKHDIEEAMRLRKFMIHLDKTLNAIKKEAENLQEEKIHLNGAFLELEKERLKFETLKKRVETQHDLEVARKEALQRDLSNSLRHSKTLT